MRFPRPRGDEPGARVHTGSDRPVFPARAGMSRMSARDGASLRSFPRPRGDEPVGLSTRLPTVKFSPPARG